MAPTPTDDGAGDRACGRPRRIDCAEPARGLAAGRLHRRRDGRRRPPPTSPRSSAPTRPSPTRTGGCGSSSRWPVCPAPQTRSRAWCARMRPTTSRSPPPTSCGAWRWGTSSACSTAAWRPASATPAARDRLLREIERHQVFGAGQSLPHFIREAPPPFTVKGADRRNVRVLAFGDLGDGSARQKRMAEAMARFHAKTPFDFAVTLGDNFYPAGMAGPADPRWQRDFERLYEPMHIRFYPSLGNHDWVLADSPAAEILYSAKSRLWQMPADRYTFIAGPVQFFALDTNLMTRAQLEWLDRELGAQQGALEDRVRPSPDLLVRRARRRPVAARQPAAAAARARAHLPLRPRPRPAAPRARGRRSLRPRRRRRRRAARDHAPDRARFTRPARTASPSSRAAAARSPSCWWTKTSRRSTASRFTTDGSGD